MSILLSMLKRLPEYEELLKTLDARQTVAVSGVSQIIRSHLIAALCTESGRPALIVCQDDMAAQRAQAELAAFLGSAPPILPSRELTFYESASVSREWEHRRMRLLYGLATGSVKMLIASMEALSLRTIPRETLFGGLITLRSGAQYDLDELTARHWSRALDSSRCAAAFSTSSPRRMTSPCVRSSSAMSWMPWAILTPSRSAGRRIWMRRCSSLSQRRFPICTRTARRVCAAILRA